jgi:hypothetical protein
MKITDGCPIYVWALFFIVFAFLAYVIGNWLMIRVRQVEGFNANTTYTYKPSSKAPNTTIQFGRLDLVADISSACAFLKVDNKLIKTDPSSNKTAKSDYTVNPSKLQIYNMYNDITSVNGSSNSIYTAMDASFAHLFDANKLKALRPQDISAQWQETNAVQIDDAIYNTVNFFVIQSGDNNRECASGAKAKVSGLSAFFIQSIIQNKSNDTVLQSLKYAYYAIVKPRFVANALSNIYWQNAQTFTNADYGSNDSILYALNTFCELVNNPTLAADLSANSAASVVGTANSPFPNNDPILMYQTASVAFEIGRFVNQFANLSAPKIQTNLSTFVAGYPQYLEKASQSAPASPLAFFMKNPPDAADCGSASILQEKMSSIHY